MKFLHRQELTDKFLTQENRENVMKLMELGFLHNKNSEVEESPNGYGTTK